MITIEEQPRSISGTEDVLMKTYYIYNKGEVYMFTTSSAYDKLIVKGLTNKENRVLVKDKNLTFANILLHINPPPPLLLICQKSPGVNFNFKW